MKGILLHIVQGMDTSCFQSRIHLSVAADYQTLLPGAHSAVLPQHLLPYQQEPPEGEKIKIRSTTSCQNMRYALHIICVGCQKRVCFKWMQQWGTMSFKRCTDRSFKAYIFYMYIEEVLLIELTLAFRVRIFPFPSPSGISLASPCLKKSLHLTIT